MPFLATVLIAGAIVAWLSVKQTTWTPVVADKAWRTPVVLAAVGAGLLVASPSTADAEMNDVILLVVEAVVGTAFGVLLGATAKLRQPGIGPNGSGGAQRSGSGVRWEARNGILGLVIWLVMITARLGLAFWLTAQGDVFARAPGAIILLLAFNRGARNLVLLRRVKAHRDSARRGRAGSS